MKFTTKQLAQTALILAICIISQFFKNLSVYITGPIINTCLILATLAIGVGSGIILSVLTPITAFFLTGSPIMAAIPLMFPAIILGNIVIVLTVHLFRQKLRFSWNLAAGLITGSVLKALFLGITVVGIILPAYGANVAAKLPKPEALPKVLEAAKITFSVTQLITALTGSLLAFLIWIPLSRYLKRGGN